jgi:hypothetical protein
MSLFEGEKQTGVKVKNKPVKAGKRDLPGWFSANPGPVTAPHVAGI